MSSMSSSDDDMMGAGGFGDWDDGSEEAAQSLFSDTILQNSMAAVAYDAAHHGFDLQSFCEQRCLDEYDVIKVINFIRAEVAAGRHPLGALHSHELPAPWNSDCYLQPVLPNDALLMHDFQYHPIDNDERITSRPPAAADEELTLLQDQNEALRLALRACAPTAFEEANKHDTAIASSTAIDTDEQMAAPADGQEGDSAAVPGKSSQHPIRRPARRRTGSSAALAADVARVDDSYFDSYSCLDIHWDMLSDKVRTEAYREALECNPVLIRGKSVVDIGCGTGILSLFAARAGAAQVVGIEGSVRMADYARRIAAANGYSRETGGPVSIVAGRIEDLQQLPDDMQQVDVLVSEWMGYALLFESMLDSVLVARDRFLKPGGAILPDLATIYLAGAGPDAGGLGFWKDVYGFDMSLVADALNEASQKDAVIAAVRAEHLVTNAVAVKTLDLSSIAASDADFTADFKLEPLELAVKPAICHFIVIWFDVEFSGRFCAEHPVKLTTCPTAPQTHWAQALLTLRQPVLLQKHGHSLPGNHVAEGGQLPAAAISGRISMARSSRHRTLDISLEYAAGTADGAFGNPITALYELAVSNAKV